MKIRLIWIPRIMVMTYTFFLLLSLLVFLLTQEITWQGVLFPLLPVAGLAFLIFYGWENPLLCGIWFFVLGSILYLFIGSSFFDRLAIVSPLIISGALFLWCWYLEKNYTFFDNKF